MRSSLLRAALAAAWLGLSLCALSCSPSMERITLSVGGESFEVEVARSDTERQKGLMGRESLGRREGMLFVFDRDQHLDFWMKDTRIPLSIAFLSSEGKILEIVDLQPLSEKAIRSRLSCRYALELPQGTFREIGAAEGTMIAFPKGFR
jgi:uncharacterized protein